MVRVDKENYYLDIAKAVAERGTCLQRNYGAIIVKHDEIVSTGYTGAPRGRKNCISLSFCMNNEKAKEGQDNMCRSVHAEANAIISAARKDMLGATLYLAGIEYESGESVKYPMPCGMCKRFIINAGIAKVVVRKGSEGYTSYDVRDWVYLDDTLQTP